jgi:hypothetical protein
MAEADEEIARHLKLFAYATREKWLKKQPNADRGSYNWPAVIGKWSEKTAK